MKPPKHPSKPSVKTSRRITYQDALAIVREKLDRDEYKYHEGREAIADHQREVDREFEPETDRTWNG